MIWGLKDRGIEGPTKGDCGFTHCFALYADSAPDKGDQKGSAVACLVEGR